MRPIAIAIASVVVAGCGGAVRATGVSVVTTGAADATRRALATPIDPAVRLRLADASVRGTVERPGARSGERPGVQPRAQGDPALDAVLAAARSAYVETLDMPACIEALSPPALVVSALARGDRDAAARVLTYLCACHLAAGDDAAAARVATQLGTLGLPIPDAADAISPRAERLLADATAAAVRAERVPLAVRSTPEGAGVWIDGRNAACVTPCTLDVVAGEHVVALTRAGSADAHETVRVSRSAAGDVVELTLPPATPELAARQWRERAGDADAWEAMRLLQIAVRDRRVVLLDGQRGARDLRLRATLVIDDQPPLRIERRAQPASARDAVRALLHDLLTEGGVIPPRPIVEEPLFWIAIAGAATIGAVVTGALLFEPDVRTPVTLRGAR
ncbi:MAG: PEGA domain-containing protein [Deltaproteobacteria bacterium]|nr:PEGA domain-containing protein [Deltaproteobacteria bacterium]